MAAHALVRSGELEPERGVGGGFPEHRCLERVRGLEIAPQQMQAYACQAQCRVFEQGGGELLHTFDGLAQVAAVEQLAEQEFDRVEVGRRE